MTLKTLEDAETLQQQTMDFINDALDNLDNLHCHGPMNLDRVALWKIRERMQDAARAMYDLASLRQDLKYV